MLNLLRADLYRLFVFKRPRGSIYPFIVLSIIAAIIPLLVFTPLLVSVGHMLGSTATENLGVPQSLTLSQYIVALGLRPGVLPIEAAVCVAALIISSCEHGFDRALFSSLIRTNHLIIARHLVAGIVSFVLLAASVVVILIEVIVLRAPVNSYDIANVILLLTVYWLVMWALSSVAGVLIPMLIQGRPSWLGYVMSIVVAGGTITRVIVSLMIACGKGLSLDLLVTAAQELMQWAPTTLLETLPSLTEATPDAWLSAPSTICGGMLPGGFVAQCLVITLVWLAISFVGSAACARMRDIA